MRFEGRRVAVTGGTGYLGGAVVRDLLAEGAEVRVLARRPERGAGLAAHGAEVLEADVGDRASLDFRGIDLVVHAAAWVAFGIPKGKRERFRRTNVEGTRNVVDAAKAAGVAKLVHVSSIAALGATHGAVADESFARGPTHRSFYEETKKEAHRIALGATGIEVAAVMPGVIVGKARPFPDGAPASGRGPFDALLERFAEGRLPAIVGGSAATAYVHVDDVAEATLRAAIAGRGPYLLTDGSYDMEELFGRFASAIGRPPPRIRIPVPVVRAGLWALERAYHLAGKVPPASTELGKSLVTDMRFDSSRARKELGWNPDLWGLLARDYGG